MKAIKLKTWSGEKVVGMLTYEDEYHYRVEVALGLSRWISKSAVKSVKIY